MTKVIVTGGAGFIGSHLTKKLINNGYKVIVIDNLSTGNRANLNKNVTFNKVDIRDFDVLKQAMKGADYVFHLAALPRIQRSVKNPLETNEVNVQGTLNVLEAARLNKVKRVIFTSSSSVYGNQKSLPFTEDMISQPLSPYALQKLIGEKYCQMYTSLYGLETICLRLFSVYGPGQNGKEEYATAIGRFIYFKKQDKSLIIYGDGNQTRDFTYVSDVVNATILAMKSEKIGRGEIINICFGKNTSINRLAKIIGGRTIFLETRMGEPKYTWGDNSLAKELLDWYPKIRLEEGLRKSQNY